MASSNAASQQSSAVPSLTATAENRIFEELSALIQAETKQSIFSVGGFIPITALADGTICDSDDALSDTQSSVGEVQLGSEATNRVATMVDVDRDHDGLQESADKMTETRPDFDVHKMRCDPVTVRWDSSSDSNMSHKLTLPCPDASQPAFEQLLRDCQPASFGRGGVDVMDETYRKAGKIDESAFCTSFNPSGLGILDTVAQVLAPNHCRRTNETHGLRAELYKLNVYSAPSGKFRAHVDTPRSKHQIGSLVVCLPGMHEGGELVLHHEGREIVFDWSGEKGRDTVQWAAFYSDCEHEVREVTSGHRLTLTYNLYSTCWKNTACIDPERIDLYKNLMNLLKEPAFCKKGRTIGYHCSHAYPHSEKGTIETLPAMLKGVDKLVHECFFATRFETRLRYALDFDLSDDNDSNLEPLLYELMNKGDEDNLRWKAFKDAFKENEHNGYTYWDRKNETAADDQLYVLSDQLVERSFSEEGMYQEGRIVDTIEAWSTDYRVQPVKWLNSKNHSEMALIHGTYGNQAGIGTKYCSMVITLKIPPFQDR